MRIAILGGSGHMGQELIRQALGRGRTVHALIRRPGSLDALQQSGDGSIHGSLHQVIGDATDSHDVATCIQQVDAVIHAVSVPLRHPRSTTLYSRTTQAVIDARPRTQAIHYVVMSSTGTDHVRQALPRGIRQAYEYLLGDVADDKQLEETILAESSLPRTVIKSPLLTSGSIQKTSLTPFSSYRPSLRDTISRQTVAHTILDIIAHGSWIRQKVVPKTKATS